MIPSCKHCGSKYVNHIETTEDFSQVESTYKCQACNKEFKVTKKKASPQGEWLMTFYADRDGGKTVDSVVFKKTAEGKLSITQQDKQVFKQVTVMPKLYPKNNPYIVFGGSYSIWYDTFRHFNDAQGTYITVLRIELNPELTKKALQNPAMKIVHKEKNVFVPAFQENDILLKDICSWLLSELRAAAPASEQTSSSANTSGGCYVATAVYGSYDCPQVWTLRRFRDNTLAETWYGRAFIRTYYAVSPTLVKWFGNTEWFKKLWKDKLDRMVETLQKNGVEDTPYEDKNWK